MVHWLLPVIAQGIVTAGAGVFVGYRVFAWQRSVHAKDTAAVLVVNLQSIHTVLYSVVNAAESVDKADRCLALLKMGAYVEAYATLSPSLGVLGHELVRKSGRLFTQLNVTLSNIQAIDQERDNTDVATVGHLRIIKDKALAAWFEAHGGYINELEADMAVLTAEICSEFALAHQPITEFLD